MCLCVTLKSIIDATFSPIRQDDLSFCDHVTVCGNSPLPAWASSHWPPLVLTSTERITSSVTSSWWAFSFLFYLYQRFGFIFTRHFAFWCFTPSFCLFAVILSLFPKHSFFIPPAPHIRWTMQFDAEIAVSDNILHKMTQFKRRLWRGKFGPRFLIDFFVKFGLARKSLTFGALHQRVGEPRMEPLLRRWHYHLLFGAIKKLKDDLEKSQVTVQVFSCPGQLNRWPYHSLTDSVSEWHTFWFQSTTELW